MSERDGAADNYLLGHTSWAIQRLLRLGQIYQPFTRRLLVEAGVTTSMSVLDVGCGPGEVSLLAAELVGETGRVLGIDASVDMLEVAQTRVQTVGLKHVTFQAADLRSLTLDQQFDVLVGGSS